MPTRSSSRGRNPRVQRERQEYRPEGSERVSTPDGVAERGWVQQYTEDMIQRANNYTKQLYDKVDNLFVEVGRIHSNNQNMIEIQDQYTQNFVSNLNSLEKKIAAIEKAQFDKNTMIKNFKRIGELEKKVASLEAKLKKCCSKSAASSKASSKASSTRSSRNSSRSSQPRTRRRRGSSFDSEDTYDSNVSYTSDQERRMYVAR